MNHSSAPAGHTLVDAAWVPLPCWPPGHALAHVHLPSLFPARQVSNLDFRPIDFSEPGFFSFKMVWLFSGRWEESIFQCTFSFDI